MAETRYCQEKHALADYSPTHLENGIEELKRREKKSGKVSYSLLMEVAHNARTLPSLLGYEYYSRLIGKLMEAEKRGDLRSISEEFNHSISSLYRLREKMKQPNMVPRVLLEAIRNDEIKASIYQIIQRDGKRTHPLAIYDEVNKEHDVPYSTFNRRFKELKEDPHLSQNVVGRYGPSPSRIGPQEPTTNKEKEKETLFEMFDHLHEDGKLLRGDGSIKGGKLLNPCRVHFLILKRPLGWRVIDDAVEEWKKDRGIK